MRRAVPLAILVATASLAHADTVVIAPAQDTTIYSEDGALANGSGQYLFAGLTSNQGKQRRALVQFGVTGAIPAGSTITSVTLTLHLERTQANTVDVSIYKVTSAWGEGASAASGEEGGGGPAVAGDATWTMRMYPSTAWTSPGGDAAATASATASIGQSLVDYTWSGAAMTADVQSWLDTPASNHGWLVRAPTATAGQSKRFASRNNGNSTIRPRLSVTFTPPLPTGACCAPDGSCVVVNSPGAACTATYSGDNTSCTPNLCPQPPGACCSDDATAACTSVPQASCTGTFHGIGSTCGAVSCPLVLTPFVDALPILPVAQSTTLREAPLQRKVHRDLPPTTLWGFDDGTGARSPGPTIEAHAGSPVDITWVNDLPAQHALTVDRCLAPDDVPRSIIHLHGGHVPSSSDGYPDDAVPPGNQIVDHYPNNQEAATLWYHDHAMGITRLNVSMGLAGFYLLRDDAEAALGLPSGADEIAMIITDATFAPDGQLQYPATWQPNVTGNEILVNGMVWPYLNVPRGKVRFRVLDGSGSRTYMLGLSDGAAFDQIGTDQGLLAAPVPVPLIMLMPGQRADIVIDFASYAPGTKLQLLNMGDPIPNVMQFVVTANAGHSAPLPATLRAIAPVDPATAVITRDLHLTQQAGGCGGNMWMIDDRGWTDITERPTLGTTEIWTFHNDTGLAHPMHMHLVRFQIVGHPELGWLDTVTVPSREAVSVIASFTDYAGKFPYHCHMLPHEDNMMMRQFEVVDPNAPDAGPDTPNQKSGGCCDASSDAPPAGAFIGALALGFILCRRRRSPGLPTQLPTA
jgi:spore coat protein A